MDWIDSKMNLMIHHLTCHRHHPLITILKINLMNFLTIFLQISSLLNELKLQYFSQLFFFLMVCANLFLYQIHFYYLFCQLINHCHPFYFITNKHSTIKVYSPSLTFLFYEVIIAIILDD